MSDPWANNNVEPKGLDCNRPRYTYASCKQAVQQTSYRKHMGLTEVLEQHGRAEQAELPGMYVRCLPVILLVFGWFFRLLWFSTARENDSHGIWG